MDAQRTAALQRMPVFGALRDDAVECLVEPAAQRRVAAGEWFFREGEPADRMYVLESGTVEILRDWRGVPVAVRRLEAGDCFGEMALIDLAPRSASVRALDDCAAIAIGPGDLMRLFERDAEQFALLQMNLARELSRRLRLVDEALIRARMGA